MESREGLLEDREERRLFYVAATRARERLVFSVATRNGAGGRLAKAEGFLTYLNEALDMDVRDEAVEWPPEWSGRIDRVIASPPPAESLATLPQREVTLPDKFVETWQERRERLNEVKQRPLDIRPSSLGDPEGENKNRDPEGERLPSETGLRAGSIAHKVLEGIDLKAPTSDIGGVVQAALGEFPSDVSEDERRKIQDDVTQMLEGFLASRTFRAEIQRFEVIGREIPCLLPDGEDGREGSVEGYIDLVIRDEEGILVIDYKSDGKVQPSNAMNYAKRKFGKQGEVYARAIASVFGGEAVRFGVAFLRTPALATWTPEKG